MNDGRVRVLHVVVAGEIGGAERMLADLVAKPAQSGACPMIALFSPNESLRRFFEHAAPNVPLFDRGRARDDAFGTLWRSLGPADVAWLSDCARRARASILHLHTFGSHLLGARAALAARARIVRTEHSTRVYDDFSCWPFSRWSLARTSAAVAVSRHVRRRAHARDPKFGDKMRVILNGVDTTHFAFSPVPSERKPFTFVSVGRLDPRKGIDVAIEALATLADARLDVIGCGVEAENLAALTRKLHLVHRVRFFGRVDDVRPHISAAHAALSSAREEGLGIANLEAMALGRPVVALPTGGVPEIVLDGQTGLLARTFPGGDDVAALAARMQDAIDHPDLAALGHSTRRFVERACSIEAMRAAYGAIYAEVDRAR
ncbi:MAG: glycosyltransferase family 4 protein [Polyangiaceae bacterium]